MGPIDQVCGIVFVDGKWGRVGRFAASFLRSESDLKNKSANLHVRRHLRPRKRGRKSSHSVPVFVLRIEGGFRPQTPIRFWDRFSSFSRALAARPRHKVQIPKQSQKERLRPK